jgi:hypothetical protein
MKRTYTLLKQTFLIFCLSLYSALTHALDQANIQGVDDMLNAGQNLTKVAAKWGGIITVVGAALALGSGRLEGALAQTVCKICIVIGLLVAAEGFFGSKISWGFVF